MSSVRWGSIRPSKSEAHWLESPSSSRTTAVSDRALLGHSVDSTDFAEAAYKSDFPRESRDSSPPKSKLAPRDKGYTSLPAAGRPGTAPRHRIDEFNSGAESENASSLVVGRSGASANGERKVFLVAVQVRINSKLAFFQRRFEVTPNHKIVSLQEYEKNLASLRRERDELKKQNQQQAESIADLNRSV